MNKFWATVLAYIIAFVIAFISWLLVGKPVLQPGETIAFIIGFLALVNVTKQELLSKEN